MNLSHAERYRSRQESAQPILIAIKAWLGQQVREVLPKSIMGKAIGYTLGQWSKLERYISDGRFEMDNNWIENAIRPVALGRKNYLFAGSHEGARGATLIYSLVATTKRPTAWNRLPISKTCSAASPTIHTGASPSFCHRTGNPLLQYNNPSARRQAGVHRTDTLISPEAVSTVWMVDAKRHRNGRRRR
ncbi:MAG: transposase [candidate division KSB1 bacterium]|nr:transposase [candidate division KSB1 bacterium]MDZ7364377.1 transposase [candidate division KSB1 bacterium]MDZ7402749.1 transposase [candidate division KSB1 bacterium]